MRTAKLPDTDSIQELARFWDTHDLTEFEDGLEPVHEPIFQRADAIQLILTPAEADAVREIAQSKDVGEADLIRDWVRENIRSSLHREPSTTKR